MTINASGWRPTSPEVGGTAAPTSTGNKALMLEEPLIFEIGDTHTDGGGFFFHPSPSGEAPGVGLVREHSA